MLTEIYIENYRVDISNDFPSLINFAIDDVKDFSARSTTWSKTIALPGSKNNNKIFGHIFQTGQSNPFTPGQANVLFNFNAAKSADCIIFQDQMQTFKGVLRLLQINLVNGVYEYEVSVFGKLSGLNAALSGALLEDLDFSAYDHVYNDANIVASWDNPGGSGYYYPLIDYGTYSTNKHDWDIKTFRPALYAREYIDKMFAAAGFRWQSDLLDSTRFKKLVVPMNKKTMTVSLIDLFSAHSASDFYGIPPIIGLTSPNGDPIRFHTSTGTGFTANPEPDKIKFTFNGTVTTNVNITFKFDGTYDVPPGDFAAYLNLKLWKNGEFNTLLWSGSAIGGTTFSFGSGVVIAVSMAPGDTIEFRLSQGEPFIAGGIVENVNFITSDFAVKSQGGLSVSVPISLGDTVTINENIPKNIRQVDFLLGIVKMFNLYVYEDRFDSNLIYLKPYINYYSKDNANAVDWTYKLNRGKPIKIKPMSELNSKIYKFKFKQDSDYYNELYRKRYNEGYGDRTYDSEIEFTQQTNEFEILFSGTPLVGYGGEDKVYSTILKQSGSKPADIKEENVDSNIRILQTKKLTGVIAWNITTNDGATVLNTLTRYGYAGHFNDPDAPTDDLNFGATKELFFVLATGNLSKNQFNVYWSGYMAEITDKDSKLLTANFYLKPTDILSLDFSKYIYVDGTIWRLNAIKDYNATKPSDCIVELLKVNHTNYTESSPSDGPPNTENFLLWSDNEVMDWTTSDGLLWTGDTPIIVNSINWSFDTGGSNSTFRIFVNGNLVLSPSSNASGNIIVNNGDVVKAILDIDSGTPFTVYRHLKVDSTSGNIYDADIQSENSFQWTTVFGQNYSITATIHN